MAGMRIGLAALALALLAPAVAEAGTYDVVSCRAPGAGGVNNAWLGRDGLSQTTRGRRLYEARTHWPRPVACSP